MVLLLSPKYMSSKFSGFLVALKNEMPYFRAFPAFFHYSSSLLTSISCGRYVPKSTISCGVYLSIPPILWLFVSVC